MICRHKGAGERGDDFVFLYSKGEFMRKVGKSEYLKAATDLFKSHRKHPTRRDLNTTDLGH